MLVVVFPWPLLLYMCALRYSVAILLLAFLVIKKNKKTQKNQNEHLNILRTAHKAVSISISFVKFLMPLYFCAIAWNRQNAGLLWSCFPFKVQGWAKHFETISCICSYTNSFRKEKMLYLVYLDFTFFFLSFSSIFLQYFFFFLPSTHLLCFYNFFCKCIAVLNLIFNLFTQLLSHKHAGMEKFIPNIRQAWLVGRRAGRWQPVSKARYWDILNAAALWLVFFHLMGSGMFHCSSFDFSWAHQ